MPTGRVAGAEGRRRLRPLAALLVLMAVGGCVAAPERASWGAHWPTGAEVKAAAVDAARSPATWVPLAGAVALSLSGKDHDLSDWAADHRPLFGHDAADASDRLLAASGIAWGVSALAAPSPSLADKGRGLFAQASALALEAGVTETVKKLSDRRRPDHSNHLSFPSGHAGFSSAATALARRNLDPMDLPGWLDTSLRVGLHGLAIGTGWARVEARRHYPTDVLAGYALGQFVASLMHASFMGTTPVEVTYQPLPDGGAVTVVLRRP